VSGDMAFHVTNAVTW